MNIDYSKIITKEMAEARCLENSAMQIRATRDDKLKVEYQPAAQQLTRWIDSSEDNPAA
ncbi:hypothetical protein MSL71_52330, partial [Desulfoluna butyratoxydans]